MLQNFFKPKWQHDNPEVRKDAIANLPASETSVLLDIARSDPEPNLRCLAVRRLNDMDILVDLMATANNWEVRQLAQQCFQQLFAGLKEGAPTLEQRLQRLNQVTDLVLLEYLAKQGKEAELRQAVLNKVNQDALCGDIAISDPVAHIRLAAIDKVSGKPTLERVVDATRNRDKGVYRIAKERLDVIIEAEEKPKRLQAQRESLCKRVDTLLKASHCDVSESELSALEQQWSAIEGIPAPELAQQFHQRISEIRAVRVAYQAHQALCHSRRAAKEALFHLVQEFSARQQAHEFINPKHAAAAQAELEEHEAAWRATEALPQAEEEQAWQQRFNTLVNDIRQHLHHAEHNSKLHHKLNKICTDLEKLLRTQTPVPKQRAKEFEQRWQEAFPASPQGEFVYTVRDRYHNAMSALQKRYQEQQAQHEQTEQELQHALSELEADLEAGALQKALPLEQRCRTLMRQLVDLPRQRHQNLEKRLHTAEAHLHELQSWQRWGNKREREVLCEAMEALIGSQEEPEILARQIKELQDEWQKLTEMDHSHSLWQRFHKAGQNAYAPCKIFFEERARTRQENLVKRQTLCDTLEQFVTELQHLDSNADNDWKKYYHHSQELRQTWFNIGPTNRKARKEVDARFEQVCQSIEACFAPERAHNLSQRRALIDEAQELINEKDLEHAINRAKHLQKAWIITVPGNRKEERELWKAFRSACDSIFARRDQVRAAENQEYQNRVEAKTALCLELEQLADQGGEALHNISQRLAQAEEKWRHLGEVPRKYLKDLDQRYHKACRRLHDVQRQWRAGQKRAQLDALRTKATLCSRLERADATTALALLEEIDSAWNTLPLLEKNDEHAIQQRFERARHAAQQGQVPLPISAEEYKHFELLCIRLEILKGRESPPESAQTRMAYQVERLARAMSGDKVAEEDGGAQELKALERAWYLSGPCPHTLEQRFFNLCEVN
jgi:DNA repair protein SbcC/Rad50